MFNVSIKGNELYQLLAATKERETLPRYIVPGIVKTKGFSMAAKISKLTADFSKENDISQREIVETALIEYFKKYGFEKKLKIYFDCELTCC